MPLNLFALCALAALTATALASQPASAGIGCPPFHKGKPFVTVDLFEGDPAGLSLLMNVNGGFIIPELPGIGFSEHPYYSLRCQYQGLKETVVVKLPKDILVCKYKFSNVSCE